MMRETRRRRRRPPATRQNRTKNPGISWERNSKMLMTPTGKTSVTFWEEHRGSVTTTASPFFPIRSLCLRLCLRLCLYLPDLRSLRLRPWCDCVSMYVCVGTGYNRSSSSCCCCCCVESGKPLPVLSWCVRVAVCVCIFVFTGGSVRDFGRTVSLLSALSMSRPVCSAGRCVFCCWCA